MGIRISYELCKSRAAAILEAGSSHRDISRAVRVLCPPSSPPNTDPLNFARPVTFSLLAVVASKSLSTTAARTGSRGGKGPAVVIQVLWSIHGRVPSIAATAPRAGWQSNHVNSSGPTEQVFENTCVFCFSSKRFPLNFPFVFLCWRRSGSQGPSTVP